MGMGYKEERMSRSVLRLFCFFVIVMLAVPGWGKDQQGGFIQLPKPAFDGAVSVERAIKERRTVRAFRPDALSMAHLSQLLWAAQGITDERRGFRAAPSGGALYPLDVYAVVGKGGVEGLGPGLYRYHSARHSLELTVKEDRRKNVASAALSQMWIATAPVVFVITAEYERITRKYGERGIRYAHIEVGHVGQNIFLQAGALGLGAGIVGAFRDASVTEAIGAPKEHEPLIIIAVGYNKKE
jgi:SagB-type dehydrogenase family enzyme